MAEHPRIVLAPGVAHEDILARLDMRATAGSRTSAAVRERLGVDRGDLRSGEGLGAVHDAVGV